MLGQGHTPVLAAPKKSRLYRLAKSEGIKVYPVEFTFLSALHDRGRIRQICINEKPDVINVHGDRDAASGLPAAKKAQVPLRILSRHTGRKLGSWTARKRTRKLSHFIFTSAPHTAEMIQQDLKLNPMKVFSIPSGIQPPGHLPESGKARSEMARQLSLEPDTRFIGFTGRLAGNQGLENLIQAFEKIHTRVPHHLVLAGAEDGRNLDTLRGLARQGRSGGRVHLTGAQDAPSWAWLRAMDCTIFPCSGHRDAAHQIPAALFKSMAAGVPVAGTRTPALTDVIRHNATGLLAAPGNSADLADIILATLQDRQRAKTRAAAARESVLKSHTLDAMGRDIIRIYRLHQVRLDREMAVY